MLNGLDRLRFGGWVKKKWIGRGYGGRWTVERCASGGRRNRDYRLAYIAATGYRGASLRLIPEWPVYGLLEECSNPRALAGRIDAIAYEGDCAEVVVDWKSDVDPSDTDIRIHSGQLENYLRATGAPRGALVYMTPGLVRWIAGRDEH
jgi:hypothetical protein